MFFIRKMDQCIVNFKEIELSFYREGFDFSDVAQVPLINIICRIILCIN